MIPSGDVDLRLAGRTVSRCYVDDAFGIQLLEDGPEVDLRLGGPFVVGDGITEWRAHAETMSNLDKALAIVHRTLTRAVARADGTLAIELSGGLTIRVPPNPPYESWTLASADGMKVVCLPSGGLAIWGPTTD